MELGRSQLVAFFFETDLLRAYVDSNSPFQVHSEISTVFDSTFFDENTLRG